MSQYIMNVGGALTDGATSPGGRAPVVRKLEATPGRAMRENFGTGSVSFRKAYLQSLIDVIEFGNA